MPGTTNGTPMPAPRCPVRVLASGPVLFLRCGQRRSELALILVCKSGLEDFASELLDLRIDLLGLAFLYQDEKSGRSGLQVGCQFIHEGIVDTELFQRAGNRTQRRSGNAAD